MGWDRPFHQDRWKERVAQSPGLLVYSTTITYSKEDQREMSIHEADATTMQSSSNLILNAWHWGGSLFFLESSRHFWCLQFPMSTINLPPYYIFRERRANFYS